MHANFERHKLGTPTTCGQVYVPQDASQNTVGLQSHWGQTGFIACNAMSLPVPCLSSNDQHYDHVSFVDRPQWRTVCGTNVPLRLELISPHQAFFVAHVSSKQCEVSTSLVFKSSIDPASA